MSDRFDDLVRMSARAAEAKFGVRHPRHDEVADEPQPPRPTPCCGGKPPERRILRDLIAELREEGHRPTPCCGGKHQVCEGCDEVWPCYPAHYNAMADRAEARLREIGGDDADV